MDSLIGANRSVCRRIVSSSMGLLRSSQETGAAPATVPLIALILGLGVEIGTGVRPSAAQEVGSAFRDCEVCPEMIVVPSGRFAMGSPETEEGRFDDEGPRHAVSIESFAVGVHEVTFEEWDACAFAGGCGGLLPEDEGWGRGRRPVINVSWEQAQAYVNWLSETTGKQYRLLTEAEWEYVAGAGTQTARYWGESEEGQCRYANGGDTSLSPEYPILADSLFARCTDGYVHTAPVGMFQPNPFGLYDVLGNVWEWTEDCWNESYSGAPLDGSAWQAGDCSQRVARGGSWDQFPRGIRSAFRFGSTAVDRYVRGGFRVARTVN